MKFRLGMNDSNNSVGIAALLPVASVGTMFHWGCVFTGLYFSYALYDFVGFPPEIMRIGCFVGIVIGLVFVRAFADRLTKTSGRIKLSLAGTCLLLANGASMLLLYFGVPVPGALLGALWAAFGAGTSLCLLAWLDVFNYGTGKATAAFVVAGVVLGGLLCFGAACLPMLPIIVLLLLFPLLSFGNLMFIYSRVALPDQITAAQSKARYALPFISSLTIGAYGAVFGVSQYMIFASDHAAASPFFIGASVAIGGSAFLLANILLARPVSQIITQRVLFPLIVTVLLFIPFADAFGQRLCWAVLMAALTCFDIANITALTRIAGKFSLAPFAFLSLGRLPIQVGMLAGWLLGFLFLHYHIVDMNMLTLITLGMVVVLVFITTVAPFEKSGLKAADRSDDRHEASPSTKGSWQLRCEEVGRKYGLSPRQRDVLVYLAKGRNAEFIQKELFVSGHTAKSHIYQIYRKLEVHSQQQLIDLVEKTRLPS